MNSSFASRARSSPLVSLLLLASVLLSSRPARAADDETDYIFKSTNLLQIQIDIPEEGIRALGRFRREPRVRVPATVTEGGTVYRNVMVQLKGRGTFQGIASRPSLTLHFPTGSDEPTFHGLTRISLNNSAQDPTCLQEKLSRELFAAAGVPAARADQALVKLNKNLLGVYVLTEGYDKRFLKRHFKRPDGTFFDGGLFEDVDRQLEAVTGNKTNFAGLRRAAQACLEPDQARRFAALSNTVDLDRFLSLIAMETILCHFDGYAMRRTNYRVYHDPASNKLVFMPQGMDRVLGNFRRHLDLPVVPPMVGMVARALLGTEEGRRLYIERFGTLYTNAFRADQLVRHVRELDRKIAGALNDPAARWETNPSALNNVISTGDHAKDIDDLCERISTRAAILGTLLSDRKGLSTPTPVLSFGNDNVARLPAWTPRATYLKPAAQWEENGAKYWHVVSPGPYTALGCRVKLPPGEYRLVGRIKSAGNEEIPRVMIRHFVTPFANQFQPLEWQAADFSFTIADGAAPEEIDIMCEIRGKGEAWIDTASFRIRRF